MICDFLFAPIEIGNRGGQGLGQGRLGRRGLRGPVSGLRGPRARQRQSQRNCKEAGQLDTDHEGGPLKVMGRRCLGWPRVWRAECPASPRPSIEKGPASRPFFYSYLPVGLADLWRDATTFRRRGQQVVTHIFASFA